MTEQNEPTESAPPAVGESPVSEDPAPVVAAHVEDVPASTAVVEATVAEPVATEVVARAADTPIVAFRTVTLPVNLVPTPGYVPTSFGVSLSGKAAQALVDYAAGLELEGIHLDPGRALNVRLERIAGE